MINFNNVSLEFSVGTKSQLPKSNNKEIVFSGHSNVGKSSLINKISNRKSLAKVSSQPGKTKTINFYKLDSLKIVDMPGYGYTNIPIYEKKRWSELVEFYFNSKRKLSLIIQLLDFRHKPTADDFQMLYYLKENNLPFVIVLTKADKLKGNHRKTRELEVKTELINYSNIQKIIFSSVTLEGVNQIKNIISKL